MPPSLILINPWIYDFAAYDLWSKPLGLLYVAGYLRNCGFNIRLIDCLDVHHPGMTADPSAKKPKRRSYGTGKYWRREVPRPFPLKNIQRPYSRYGISPELFQEELSKIPNPKAILVTSLMTYWYPGVKEVIDLSKKNHPNVPVILGGIYARLCHNHAVLKSGADLVVNNYNVESILALLDEYGISTPGPSPDPGRTPRPAFDLLSRVEYICILTSMGCPYRCRYCASHFLNPDLIRRDPGEVLEEILYWHRNFNVRDFAFYDDALLVSFDTHLAPLLEEVARLELDLRFHTPNALHIKEITPDIASLMHQTGFRTIRLGLETSDFSLHRDLDNKVAEGDFERALKSLLKAGFARNQIGAYVLMGLPGQSVDSVFESIDFVGRTGAMPYLSEYSPIPHTPMWEQALNHSRYDLTEEPLFHNNTLLPCWDDSRIKELPRLRKFVLEIRQKYR
jgi:radical SAM superfamily enzyme YgiQ (UPF0313 family)